MKRAILTLAILSLAGALTASVELYRDLSGGHATSISCVDFSGRVEYLASADLAGTVIIWDSGSGTRLVTINHGSPVESVAFSPDSKLLATGGRDGSLKLWHVAGGGLIKSFEGERETVFSVSFSPDSRLLAAATHKRTEIFGVQQQKKYFDLPAGEAWVRCARFSSDGKYLFTAAGTAAVMWEINHKDLMNTLLGKEGLAFRQARSFSQGYNIFGMDVSPDSQLLACAGERGLIKIWRTGDGFLVNAFTQAHAGNVWSLSFSRDSSVLASAGSDATVRLWDLKTQKPAGIIAGNEDEVYSVSFSPESGLLASGSRDMKLKLWKIDAAGGAPAPKGLLAAVIGSLVILLAIAAAVTAYRREKAKVKYWRP